MTPYARTHLLQDSVSAIRASITPVLCEWTTHDGNTHRTEQPLMIEARGDDGTYVRGFTAVTLREVGR